ncbi:hypothetical protein GW17_00040506 [Ensete ventricosum]|nr:hypothetical protein GW17_00040506 [Ensete ventricosum]
MPVRTGKSNLASDELVNLRVAKLVEVNCKVLFVIMVISAWISWFYGDLMNSVNMVLIAKGILYGVLTLLDSHNWNTFENAPGPLERDATMRRSIDQFISDRNGKLPIFEREWKSRSVLVGGENLVRVDFYGENVMEKLLNGLVATLLKSFYARFAVPVCTGISRFGWYGTVRAVHVPVNHRTGMYRPYRAVIGISILLYTHLFEAKSYYICILLSGVLPTEGIPSLLKVLLPSDCVGLPAL